MTRAGAGNECELFHCYAHSGLSPTTPVTSTPRLAREWTPRGVLQSSFLLWKYFGVNSLPKSLIYLGHLGDSTGSVSDS